jgi:hypothetical protein
VKVIDINLPMHVASKDIPLKGSSKILKIPVFVLRNNEGTKQALLVTLKYIIYSTVPVPIQLRFYL